MTDSSSDFVGRYGEIYENSPWVAERCEPLARGVHDAEPLARIFAACVDAADAATRLALIRAHPDLAGKIAMRGELGAASRAEQASAGIDECSAEEYRQFQHLNGRYKAKFGFPFVMAVRGRNRGEILDAFKRRLDNEYEAEFANAIAEIHEIARLRLAALEGNG